ncbi:MAG: hypothetical protein CVV64_09725 [Candidatus Wallbacteria bacterium HGW-Wallbacteria-1]|jgi:DNA polymerase-3 subunit gamma/tau|uniref:Uncharacterized protein n=1 Tax=Candidatus Wallbacteria bacterium HGW-Wallbacteria-1 TaxID=2013854 RepID=A0A2N1PQK7_9BACT|nr:MAG: hypothetical protein CVV64_09725 [Candidatus Wallbacteria bacterium HGW-Wallbacteria-1]
MSEESKKGLETVDSPSENRPVTDHTGPVTDHQGPVTDHDGPVVDHSDPVTDHNGPVVDFKGKVEDRPEDARMCPVQGCEKMLHRVKFFAMNNMVDTDSYCLDHGPAGDPVKCSIKG